jgi:hypothetical protein
MKVLKIGKDRNVGRELTCDNCGALLLVVPNDVKEYQSTGYTSCSTETHYYVICPDCEKGTNVSYKYKTLR